MAFCKLGHIYIVNTVLTKPPKAKFALCICIDNGFFVWINTNPRPHGNDQLVLPAGCHELIRHDSYLDLSRLVVHQGFELEDAKEFACIDRDLCQRIIETVDAGLKVLPARHAEIVLTNLRKLL